LAITHLDHGIKVSVLCPQAVRTAMIGDEPEKGSASVDGIISPEEVAESVIDGLAAERFLILPHPVVAGYMQRKTADYDRWLGACRNFGASCNSEMRRVSATLSAIWGVGWTRSRERLVGASRSTSGS